MLTHLMNNNKIQEYDLVIEIDDCTLINPSLNKVVTLSPSECLILKYLMDNSSQTLGREYLLTHCWPGRIVTSSSLNVAIKNVRSALKEVGSDCKVITVQKEGYCFVVPEKLVVPENFSATEALVTSENLTRSENLAVPGSLAAQEKGAPQTVCLDERESSAGSESTPVSESNESAEALALFENSKTQESEESSPAKRPPSRFIPFVSGLAVSVFLIIILSYLGLFMDRASINGIGVYHDNVELEPELVDELTLIATPGIEAIYLHRVGVECGGIQVVILDQSGWQDISADFKSRRCSQGKQEHKNVEGTQDEA